MIKAYKLNKVNEKIFGLSIKLNEAVLKHDYKGIKKYAELVRRQFRIKDGIK